MGIVTKLLLLSNIIIFILGNLLMEQGFNWYDNFALYENASNFKLHQLITHMFLHGDFQHLFFNMLILSLVGSIVENYFKSSYKFIIFYILCGLFACSLHMLISTDSLPMIGASGAIFGLFITSALIEPNKKVQAWFIPVPLKIIVLVFTIMEVWKAFDVQNDGIAHFAHIGGAIGGVLLYYSYKLIIKWKN